MPSVKHLSPCPICKRWPRAVAVPTRISWSRRLSDCKGHTPEEWRAHIVPEIYARRDRRHELTPAEMRRMNRERREALRLKKVRF